MLVPFIFAFLAVLALIGVAAWLVRRFASSRLGASTNRGRMPRLAVIDAAAVDGRRRLVLVRRDNIEHLLMIGGPTDIVVESNIVRASQAREQLPPRTGLPAAAPEPSRIVPLPDTAWNEAEAARADTHEPPLMPEPPPRPVRPSFADELRRPVPQPVERRSSEPLTGFTPEQLGGRPEPRPEPRQEARPEPRADRPEPRPELRPEPRMEPRPEPVLPRMPSREPMPRPARPAAEMPKGPPLRPAERASAPPAPAPSPPTPPAPAQNADQNLAEMAQRLEAALRRPAGAAPTDTAPPVAPEPPVRDRAATPPRSEPPMAPPPAPAAPPKSSFENLEDEMASLLGRPKSSSS